MRCCRTIERRGFFNAWLAPRGPEIQQHYFAAQVGKLRGLAVQRERKILWRASAQARFALPIVRTRKQHEKRRDESQNEPVFSFRFNPPSKRPIIEAIADEITNSLAAPRGSDCKNLGFRHHSRPKRRSLDRARGRIGGDAARGRGSDRGERQIDRPHRRDSGGTSARGYPKLKVLEAGPLPAGWVGKNHAVVGWRGGGAGRLAAFHGCGHVSLFRVDAARAERRGGSRRGAWCRIRRSRRWKRGGSGR